MARAISAVYYSDRAQCQIRIGNGRCFGEKNAIKKADGKETRNPSFGFYAQAEGIH
jgi:hypothetical protein